MTLDEAKKAWADSPKGKLSSKEKADLITGEWQTPGGIPTLVGQRFKATASRNEKANITFRIEKI
jgi:hypothetical protein